jgi:hypothetical protein
MLNDFSILSARFEPLRRPVGLGWVMLVTTQTRNIRFVAFPFVARVGEQPLDFLCYGLEGEYFEGYLKRIPNPGDRLFVGYNRATVPTSIVYQPTPGPAVA